MVDGSAPTWQSASGGRIPKARYVDPAFLALELERVFGNTWLLAGPLADVREPGTYFTFELANESVLIVRDADELRAFHNACAHRGRRLREPGLGQTRSFRCPYHLWDYDLDGSLRHLPDADCFARWSAAQRPRLASVHCEAWAGFVWISFASRPEPLAEFLGPVAERLAAYDLGEYALVEDQTVDLPCNWKVGVDAFNEAYHLRAVHPQLLQMLDEENVEIELLGNHSCIRVPFATPSPNAKDRTSVNDLLRYLLQEAGLDPARFTQPATAVRGEIQRFLRQRSDFDLSRLTDEQLTDNHQYHVFPNLTLNVYAMKHMLIRHRPHPTDPNRMLMDQQQYVRVPRDAERPARPKAESFHYGSGSLGFVTDQDTFNLVRVQQGMQSGGFDGLLLGENECRIRHMHEGIDAYLARES